MKDTTKNIDAITATNRFGLGAKPGEIKQANENPKQWLIDSLKNITPPATAPTALEMMQLFAEYKDQKKDIKKKTSAALLKGEKNTQVLKPTTNPNVAFNENSALIVNQALKANESINWRLLDFFSNHFSVTSNRQKMKFIAPSIDWDAIAPNLMNRFENMLIAVISHPAMLFYLNNENSIGPDSETGKRRIKLGLNENLAREILELHTLGVNGGYNQEDIIELAKAISGWSVVKTSELEKLKKKVAFSYRNDNHQPGTLTVLGKKYPETKKGIKQARLILKKLSIHPSTAEHICTKLAVHFVSDTPSEKLISSMIDTWRTTNGHLKSVYITMINSEHSWQSQKKKYKTPRDFLISTLRALNVTDVSPNMIIDSLRHLGQSPYNADSPSGYGDTRADWDGANALYARIDWTVQIAKQYSKNSITKLTADALGNHLEKQTKLIINRAESQQQALSLLLMSPDFLHR